MKFKQVHAAGWPVLSGPARPQPGNHGMTRRAMMATCSAHWAIHRELSGESGEMQLELETAVTIADSGSTGPPSGGSARPGPAPPGPRSRAAPGRAGVSGGPGLTGLPPNFQAPALAQSGHSPAGTAVGPQPLAGDPGPAAAGRRGPGPLAITVAAEPRCQAQAAAAAAGRGPALGGTAGRTRSRPRSSWQVIGPGQVK